MLKTLQRLQPALLVFAVVALFQALRVSAGYILSRLSNVPSEKSKMVLDWIAKAPKVELHVHLDGAFNVALLYERAKNMDPAEIPAEKVGWSQETKKIRQTITDSLGSMDAFREIVSTEGKLGGLGKVLDCFELFFPLVMGNQALLRLLTEAFCQSQKDQNIIYTETRYAPHFLALPPTQNAKSTLPDAESVVMTINDVLTQWSARNPDFLVNQILCCVDSQPQHSAEVAALAIKYAGEHGGVVGVDVACGEFSFKAEDANLAAFALHREALRQAKAAGLGVTVHAGESGPAANVLRAMEEYNADRIGHGYAVCTDDAVLARVRQATPKPHFELCPTSSFACDSVPDPEQASQSGKTWAGGLGVPGGGWDGHALSKMVGDDALSVSVSSDDPAVFGCSLGSDLSLLASKLSLPPRKIQAMTEAAVRASFVAEDSKRRLLKVVAAYYGRLQV